MAQVDADGLKEDLLFICRSHLHLLDRRSFSEIKLTCGDSKGIQETWTRLLNTAESSKKRLVVELHGGIFNLGNAYRTHIVGELLGIFQGNGGEAS